MVAHLLKPLLSDDQIVNFGSKQIRYMVDAHYALGTWLFTSAKSDLKCSLEGMQLIAVLLYLRYNSVGKWV